MSAPAPEPLVFAAVAAQEIPVIQELARIIWHAHYPEIITTAQIDYMLDRFFCEAALRRDLDLGAIWELARIGSQPVGFLACLTEGTDRRLKLSKLYLRPEFHGRGFGRQMLNRVRAIADERSLDEIHLTVNKHNTKAIRAYERFGFRRTGEVVADIGAGFVMDDYQFSFDCRQRGQPTARSGEA